MMTSSNGNIFRVTGPLCGETVNSPHKGQWRGALMLSLICALTHGWVHNRKAGDLRRYCAHYDVTVMYWWHKYICPWQTLSYFLLVLWQNRILRSRDSLPWFANSWLEPTSKYTAFHLYILEYYWEYFRWLTLMNLPTFKNVHTRRKCDLATKYKE